MDWNLVVDVGTSGRAITGYAIAAYVLLLAGGVYVLIRSFTFLEYVTDPDAFVEARLRHARERAGAGPRPSDSIARREALIARARANAMRELALGFTTLVIAGFALPSLLLATFALAYPLIDPNAVNAPFVSSEETTILTVIPLRDLFLFTLDEGLAGATFDVCEVFGVRFSGVTNNPENLLFSAVVVLYRTAMGLTTGTLFLFLAKVGQSSLRFRMEQAAARRERRESA